MRTELDLMSFGYDEESNVAVQDRIEKDANPSTQQRSPLLERVFCPNCRMLLSVIETRIGTCRTCHTDLNAESK